MPSGITIFVRHFWVSGSRTGSVNCTSHGSPVAWPSLWATHSANAPYAAFIAPYRPMRILTAAGPPGSDDAESSRVCDTLLPVENPASASNSLPPTRWYLANGGPVGEIPWPAGIPAATAMARPTKGPMSLAARVERTTAVACSSSSRSSIRSVLMTGDWGRTATGAGGQGHKLHWECDHRHAIPIPVVAAGGA